MYYFQAYNGQAAVEVDVTLVLGAHISPSLNDKYKQPLAQRFNNPAVLPESTEPIDKMRQKLKTVEGRKVYAKRKSRVAPVFGSIKHVLAFRHFFLRGLEVISGEWTLVSMIWNFKRMFALNG